MTTYFLVLPVVLTAARNAPHRAALHLLLRLRRAVPAPAHAAPFLLPTPHRATPAAAVMSRAALLLLLPALLLLLAALHHRRCWLSWSVAVVGRQRRGRSSTS